MLSDLVKAPSVGFIAVLKFLELRNLTTRFGGAIFYVLVGRLTFLILMYAAGHLVAAEPFGLFMIALSASQVLAFICMVGTGPASQVVISDAIGSGKQRRIKTFVYFAIILTIAGSAVTSAVLLFAKLALLWFGGSDTTQAIITFIAIFTPVMAFSTLREYLSRAFGEIALTFAPRDIGWSLLFSGVLYSFPASRNHILASASLSLLLVESIGWVVLWRRRITALSSRSMVDIRFYRRWVTRSISMMANFVGGLAFERIDTLSVGFLVGAAQAGVYGVASRVAPIISITQRFVVPVITPRVAGHFATGNYEEVKNDLKLGVVISCLTAAPMFLGIELLADKIMLLFGNKFEAGVPILRILAFGFFANAIGTSFGAIVTASKRPWLFSRITYSVLIPMAIAMPIVTALFGAIASALLVTVGMITNNVLLLLTGWRIISREHR
jgi:O-antigen/teichoic acid export membrane protein